MEYVKFGYRYRKEVFWKTCFLYRELNEKEVARRWEREDDSVAGAVSAKAQRKD